MPRAGTLGIVGESGCGKSTLLRAVLGILPAAPQCRKGAILFDGEDILTDRAATVRGRIGYVPQDPYLSLNPVFRAGDQILEIMRRHAPGSRADHKAKLIELLRAVQLPDPEAALRKYPHQFSGGQRQRLLIAAALACDPALVVADEPTTALDVTTQREILGLLRQLTVERGLSLLFVTHDFGVLAAVCDRVAVLYAGQVVEHGPDPRRAGRPAAPLCPHAAGLPPGPRDRPRRHPRHRARRHRPAARLPLPSALPPGARPPAPRPRRRCCALGAGRSVACPYHAERLRPLPELHRRLPPHRRARRPPGPVPPPRRGARGGWRRPLGRRPARSSASSAKAAAARPPWPAPCSACSAKPAGEIRLDGRARLRPGPGAGAPGPRGGAIRPPGPRRRARPLVARRRDPGRGAVDPRRAPTGPSSAPRIAETLAAVGLDAAFGDRYPHELSGGQQRRIGLARILLLRPKLVILDEPTAGLDLSVQAAVLRLLRDLRGRFGLTYLFISHDLSVVRRVCDRVAVMYLGRIVEQGSAAELFEAPRHPYTRALLAAAPRLDGAAAGPSLPGDPPSLRAIPSGCRFHPRCALADARCAAQDPPVTEIAPGHTVACHHWGTAA